MYAMPDTRWSGCRLLLLAGAEAIAIVVGEQDREGEMAGALDRLLVEDKLDSGRLKPKRSR